MAVCSNWTNYDLLVLYAQACVLNSQVHVGVDEALDTAVIDVVAAAVLVVVLVAVLVAAVATVGVDVTDVAENKSI